MADVKWIKIVTDIFDDEKILLIETMPEADSIIVIWFKLLCLAGKQNNSGVFIMNNRIPYTEKMLATIFRRKETTVSMALQIFEEYGMIEIIDGVVTIPNWDKHQSLEAYERIKERDRERKRKARAEQKALASTNSTDASTDTSMDGTTDVHTLDKTRLDKTRLDKNNTATADTAFDKFWSCYPKKVGKEAARRAFKKVHVDIDTLVAAVEKQKASDQWQRGYIPNPTTWLNQGRWEDEVEPTPHQATYQKPWDDPNYYKNPLFD